MTVPKLDPDAAGAAIGPGDYEARDRRDDDDRVLSALPRRAVGDHARPPGRAAGPALISLPRTTTAPPRISGFERHCEHDLRAEMADEWIDVVSRLMGIMGSRTPSLPEARRRACLLDHRKVHEIDFAGRYYKSRVPMNAPPGPQRLAGDLPGRRLPQPESPSPPGTLDTVVARPRYRGSPAPTATRSSRG